MRDMCPPGGREPAPSPVVSMRKPLEKALALVGPLEGRIMREVWTGGVPALFVVRDMQARMPDLAYTTVMTTLSRLAHKGLLRSAHLTGRRAYGYAAAGSPEDFVVDSSRREVAEVIERYGDVALSAFAARLRTLTPAQRGTAAEARHLIGRPGGDQGMSASAAAATSDRLSLKT